MWEKTEHIRLFFLSSSIVEKEKPDHRSTAMEYISEFLGFGIVRFYFVPLTFRLHFHVSRSHTEENPYTTAPDSIQDCKGVDAGPAISTFYMQLTRMPADP